MRLIVPKQQFLKGMADAYDTLAAARHGTLVFMFEGKTADRLGMSLGMVMAVKISVDQAGIHQINQERSKKLTKPHGRKND